jgi:serine phosphatase RsbU (regulator of sigma subunit)
MWSRINKFWFRCSRIGLLAHEGVADRREVVFLNRIMLVIPIVMLFYVPLEIMLNGTGALYMVFIFIVALTLPLVFNHYRLFSLARYYSFIVGILFILGAGLTVGRGVNNHVAFIALALLGIILFNNMLERLFTLALCIACFLLQQVLFDKVEPTIIVSAEAKAGFTMVFFVLVLVLNFLLGYYFVGLNREYEAIIISQKDALAHKNKEITDSINYAQRIQASIIPSKKELCETLGQYFVVYIPKDIVAGDFYWVFRKNDIVMWAVADCTGHGVPGALVSVVCNNALNRSVTEYALTKPSLILDRCRELVIAEFAKSDHEIMDGMDISLCALDKASRRLAWAGANNPLVICGQDGLKEIPADKQPVGKHEGGRPFVHHELELSEGDVVYCFSDGFSDQFGGAKGKKFKYSALRNLLGNIAREPLHVQEARLIETFSQWKGPLEQVDDVCVMGVRV